MSLAAAARLGPFEILAPLGAGGMGEVYKARDTRLDRIVAIKVLSASYADDPQFRERFEREARAISALHHPNICTLFDIGQQGSTSYLVLEYLDGQTLADRIAKGPLPLDEALRIAIQITEALDRAHTAGIVHRDLKPGNVFLARSGATSAPPVAKLLDFGLAKRAAPASVAMAAVTTATPPLTGQGTILGTFKYMAPEQVEGLDADARTDIWALGCVLYEMLTGGPAFEGKTQASLIAAILERAPRPLAERQPLAPVALDRIVQRCLAKLPDDRWQSARDLGIELRWVGESPESTAGPATRPGARALGWFAGGAAAAALAILAAQRYVAPAGPVDAEAIRAEIALGEASLRQGQGPSVAISPDGRFLVYAVAGPPSTPLYLRRLTSADAVPLPASEGGVSPFFSFDSRWVGFVAGGRLKKVPVEGGGPAQTIDESVIFRGAAWLPDDSIVLSAGPDAPLVRVPAGGGPRVPVTRLNAERGDKTHRFPDVLPDGRTLLFTAADTDVTTYEDGRLVLQSIGGENDRVLIEHAMYGRYLSSGHIAYARGATIFAVPFDATRGEITGAAVPIFDRVAMSPTYGFAEFGVSRSGLVAYAPGGLLEAPRRVLWVDRQGQATPAMARTASFSGGRPSPDGRRLVVEIAAANNMLWLHDVARDALTRLTFKGDAYFAIWTPDSASVTYATGRVLRSIAADGSGTEEVLYEGTGQVGPSSWSPDGRVLAFHELRPGTGFDILLFDRAERRATPWLSTASRETLPQFSPDGRWLAYLSDESGRSEIYLRPYGRAGGKWQVSLDGATQFQWNPKGGEIVFRQGRGFFAVPVTLGETPVIGKAAHLFDSASIDVALYTFGISPDGQRVLVQETLPPPTISRLSLIVNGFAELQARMRRPTP